MKVKIWHNPRCSKSRATLALLEQHQIEPEIRYYLEDSPDEAELRKVLDILDIPAIDLVRRGEPEFRLRGLTRKSSDDSLIAAMAACPKLIERPIVFVGRGARIGRPPETVLDLIL